MADSEPENELASSDAVMTQIELLDRVEHQRRTWELELLISGAVVFALFGIPARLDDFFLETNAHISRGQYFPVFYSYFYIKLIVYSLIFSFCANLSLRGYWIGLVGLNKVFPQGIQWDKSKEGPISKRLSQSFPDLRKLIERTDRACSLVFSSSFMIIFIFLFSIFFVGAASLIAWLLSVFALSGEHFQTIFFSLITMFLIVPGIAGLVDKALTKKPPESWEGKWFAKLIHTILKAFYWVSMRPVNASVQLTLSTNLRKNVTAPLSLAATILLIGIFRVSMISRTTGKLPFHGYLYFPDVAVDRSVDYRHYESQQPEGEIYRVPSIQSDIVSDPFVRLFIPYSPRRNPLLAELCPGIEPVPQEGFSLRRSSEEFEPPKASVDAALTCLAKLHRIYLNDELLEPEFDFHVRPDTRERGIVSYLSVESLPKGRNALRIERAQSEEERAEELPPTEFFIPFWI